MIDLVDIRYVRLGTADLADAVRFATETIGLELVREENGGAWLRGDDRDHNVHYFDGDPDDHTVGFEIGDEDAFLDARRELEDAGIAIEAGNDAGRESRRCMDYLTFRDPTGNKIDLALKPFHSGRRYFPSRDAGITEFSHIGIKTSDSKRDEAFWTRHFNFRVSDWIGPAALMTFDTVHHRMALFPTDHAGIQHINFQVASIDDIMRSWYHLTERQIKIRFGPGRHPTSGAMFLYYDGPDGVIYEYSSGVREILPEDNWRPRQFPFDSSSFCMWGAKPQIAEFDTE